MRYLECIRCGKRAAWVTFWGNLAGGVFKGIVGVAGQSKALIADAFHSIADAVIGIVTVISLEISGKSPDKEHPYGHGKVEFISAAVVTAGLLFAVVFLFKKALEQLTSGTFTKPHLVTLFAAIVAIIFSEILYRYNICAGKNLNSPALTSNAWHNRYDVYTSIVVAIGIIGAKLGLHFLDPVAAIFVGIVIVKIAVEIFRDAYRGLMDTALPPEEREKIIEITSRIKGVKKVVTLKTRRMGQQSWVDLSIEVNSSETVDTGYRIAELIRETILLKMENIEDVQVAIVPSREK